MAFAFSHVACLPGRAQSPVTIPRTNLAPIDQPGSGFGAPAGSPATGFGGPAASFGGPATGFGSPAPNTTPRLRFGQSAILDPYAIGPGTGTFQPAMPPGSMPPSNPGTLGGLFGGGNSLSPAASAAQPPGLFSPSPGAVGSSPVVVPSTTFGPGAVAGPVYPQTIYPSGSPSTLFPGGLFGGRSGWFGGSSAGGLSAYQLLHGPRVRHTFINAGNGLRDLEINDTDVSIALAYQNFLQSTQPLYVVPSFSLHLWDGPQGSTGSDLPANAYSAFLDFGWQTDPNQMFGVELGVRVGAFTQFETFRDDSIRVLGKGLASFRLTPATTFKAGVYYLDRNRVKLLPAVGWLWQPNPYTRFDIFFPQPKFARYWRTIGTRDVWWYVSGDYGGDNWTIKRDDGRSDQIDINDIRIMAGMEWGLSNLIRSGRRSAFVEIGYVFDREVIYRHNPGDNFNADDGVMFRGGIGY